MKLPKFSLVQSDPDDLPGCGYILHGEEAPYHLGRIVKYGNAMEMASLLSNKPNFIQSQVTGYSIVISLAGSMGGKIYLSAEGPGKLQQLIKEMAAWYFETYIKDNNKFKKYKL